MSQRFVRCPHCRLPHDASAVVCPTDGQPIEPALAKEREERARERERRLASGEPTTPPVMTAAPPIPTPGSEGGLVGVLVEGKYLVRSILGRGGMATVYEAEQTSIGRSVALKVLHLADTRPGGTSLKRFLREAKVAAQLPHPAICQVFDFGSLPDGSPYICMEKLEGESLSERLRREGPLKVSHALDLACQVLPALGFAHKRNVLHRDVKPENIFLAKVGTTGSVVVKVLDFGLSKVMSDTAAPDNDPTQLTRMGVTMGTPFYMAPEQALGDRDLDPRVDVWAVGVTLYECLTNVRPFNGETNYDLMRAIVTSPPRPLGDVRSDLPPGLEEVVHKALAKRRDARYPSAGALQRELLAILKTVVGGDDASLKSPT